MKSHTSSLKKGLTPSRARANIGPSDFPLLDFEKKNENFYKNLVNTYIDCIEKVVPDDYIGPLSKE